MDSRDDGFGLLAALDHAALFADAKARPENGLRGRRPKEHQYVRLDDLQLGSQPRSAGPNLADSWLLVKARLAARLEAEVFDGVGDVRCPPLDACLGERTVEEFTRRADEGPALAIFRIPRLLTNEDDPSTLW